MNRRKGMNKKKTMLMETISRILFAQQFRSITKIRKNEILCASHTCCDEQSRDVQHLSHSSLIRLPFIGDLEWRFDEAIVQPSIVIFLRAGKRFVSPEFLENAWMRIESVETFRATFSSFKYSYARRERTNELMVGG